MRVDWARNETLVAAVILVFCAVATASDPNFLSLTTLFDLLRNSIVTGIFAIGVLLVLVSGGIDVSFTAIAAFAMYSTTLVLVGAGVPVPWYAAFALSILIGAALGLVNAVFIAGFRLPTLIVTLGTLSVIRGFLLTFVGSKLISNIPPGMRDFSRLMMIRGTTEAGYFYALPWAFAALVLVVAGTWFLLHRTLLGRQIFALGGSMESARRIGINVRSIQVFVYVYVGALSGLAGIIHASLARVANPFDLVGLELSVIAATVLGGARLAGGTGTITGTLLGVALIVLVSNSLILLGIPSTWQSVVIGALILVGTGLPAYQARRAALRAG
ncbi:monosaccharide-transporting ATPase [Aureimonas endophytica]|uniref:Monosaccharide-transporting ATPase n=1 Tax=Aureimonas endophytica TaxID=2027858 RepID=A0A916ZNB0_9HYPH|nr:ABC transporter permease [Aureimonas endophytica]GGE06066.1 monosaccharide-transporting ATPase [Aureimonas endophytica]